MAIYPTDAIGSFTTDSFTSMADRRPDKGYSEERTYNVIVFESEAGYEKRRLRSRRPKRKIDLEYSNIHGLAKEAIENFYHSRAGEFESFTLNLDHLNESGVIRVRFSGALKITEVLADTSANALNNFYTVSFTLQETFD